MTTKETSEKNVSEVEPRTSRALEEYLTVLHDDESGLCEVYSESGEEYVVDPQNGACECPDFLHNLNGDELCKHARRARFALGLDAVPTDLEAVEINDELGKFTNAPLRFAASDGGVIESGDDAVVLEEEDDEAEGVRDPYAHRDTEVDTTPLGTVDRDEEDTDECEDCAELSELPCFECYMNERGHSVGGDA